MESAESIPAPLETIPDPAVLRRMIAEHVECAEQLRKLLRLSMRRERLREQPSGNPAAVANA